MLKIKLLQENGFKSSLRSVTVTGLKNLFSGSSIVWAEREAMRLWGSMRYRNKVHFLSYICALFHFDTLSGSEEQKVEALLSEHHL
jgi:hypothetical protein